jgi:hypothetical protein
MPRNSLKAVIFACRKEPTVEDGAKFISTKDLRILLEPLVQTAKYKKNIIT